MNEDLNRNYGATLEVKEENVLLGTIGALIGALAGVVLIVILARIGYVASVSGVVMAYASLFLYAKFAGKMSVKGIIICIVIMIVTVFLTQWVFYSYIMYKSLKDYGFTFGMIFKDLMLYLGWAEIEGSFIKDTLTLYGFTALGAIPQIMSFVKKKPEEAMKPVEMTLANGNTVQNTTETIDTDLLNGENSAKKFDDNFFN